MSFDALVKVLEQNFDPVAYLGNRIIREEGGQLVVQCPECEKPKLYVLKKGERGKPPGTWICYRCGDGEYSPLTLIRLLDGLPYFDTYAILSQYSSAGDASQDVCAVVEKVLSFLPDDEPVPEDLDVELPEGFVPCERGKGLPSYFWERGIGEHTAAAHKLGWCTRGRYDNRLIVPVYRKQVLAWYLGRWMGKNPPKNGKRYLNSTNANSSWDLYGVERVSGSKRAILVEDVFSKLCVGKSSLATFGTHISKAQFKLLASTGVEEMIICWDRDAIDKAWRFAELLADIWTVKVVELPDARDPDELGRSLILDLVDKAEPYSSASSTVSLVNFYLGLDHARRPKMGRKRWSP